MSPSQLPKRSSAHKNPSVAHLTCRRTSSRCRSWPGRPSPRPSCRTCRSPGWWRSLRPLRRRRPRPCLFGARPGSWRAVGNLHVNGDVLGSHSSHSLRDRQEHTCARELTMGGRRGGERTASSNLAPAWRPVASASFSYCWPRPGSSPLTFAEALWTSAVSVSAKVEASREH